MNSKRHPTCALRWIVGLLLLAAFGLAPIIVAAQTSSPATAPRLVVKFKAPLAREIEPALGLPDLELQRPSLRVQGWLQRHQLRTLRPLYPAALRQRLQSGRSERELAERVRDRFAQRTLRAPANVTRPELLRTYLVELNGSSPSEWRDVLERLRADPDVEFAQLDQTVRLQLTPNDPYFSSNNSWGQGYADLYGVKKIGCQAAWNDANGSGVIVAVIDTGVDHRHRDITNQMWLNTGEVAGNGVDDDDNGFVDDRRGWNFVTASLNNAQPANDPGDRLNGHGTHVAGTVAAQGNNNRGIVGVAYGARVMAVRALDDVGQGPDSAQANAIVYAADNGADIINASWGARGESPVIEDAMNYAASLGVVFVAAAGNSVVGNIPDDVAGVYPSRYAVAIAVSALTPDDTIAWFSNTGYGLDVSAPGMDILSLRSTNVNLGIPLNAEYTRAEGTSMAAPHVAGTAALILSLHPTYTPEEVRQVLRRSADRVTGGDFDPYLGHGRVNADDALELGPVLSARILSPHRKQVLEGVVAVTGVAAGSGFSSYTLDYGAGDEPVAWTLLVQNNAPVDHATLGAINAASLADGRYTLRLRAFDSDDGVFEDRLQVEVDYTVITAPVPPAVPTVAAVFKPGVQVEINGTAHNGTFQSFRVEWARGSNPNLGYTNAGVVLSGGGSFPVTNGRLATWNSGVVTQADFYTLRLLMLTAAFTNEARSVVYLEPDLYSTNWPRWLDQSSPYESSVVPARDVSGNPHLVVASPNIVGTSPPQLRIFSLAGESITNVTINDPYRQPSVANLDGVPGDEIVVTMMNAVRVLRLDGSWFAPTVPVAANFYYELSVLADLDADDQPELLAWGSDRPNLVGRVFAWKANGQLFSANYPLGPFPDLAPPPLSRIATLDVEPDGIPEFIVQQGDTGESFSLRMLRVNGQPANWQVPVLNGTYWTVATGDLDGDGVPEVVVAYSTSGGRWLQAYSANGTPRPGWPVALSGSTPLRMLIADLDRDGRCEVVATAKMALQVFCADGSAFTGMWPLVGNDSQSFGSPIAGDVDGDGIAEILVTRDHAVSNPLHKAPNLVAYRPDGQLARSWRLIGAQGNQPFGDGTVVIGDFDGDGKVNLAVNYQLLTGGGVSGQLEQGMLTVLSLDAPWRPHPRDWPMNYHDARNSAAALVPARLRAARDGPALHVSWPKQPDPSVLEASGDLRVPAWSPLASPVLSSNGLNTMILPATNGHRWFRLKYP
jgi:subtilisin family serine protease